jgi:hypothetical protein
MQRSTSAAFSCGRRGIGLNSLSSATSSGSPSPKLSAIGSRFDESVGAVIYYGLRLPDFSWYNIPKLEKIYQIAIKYTKCPQNIPTTAK